MYAYHTRLDNVKRVVLLYPFYAKLQGIENLGYFVKEKNIEIRIVFFDLLKYIRTKNFNECVIGVGDSGKLLPLKQK